MGKIALVFTTVMMMLAVFAPPTQALGTPNHGEIFYLCSYSGQTTANGLTSETWQPCNARQDLSSYSSPVLLQNSVPVMPNREHIYIRNEVAQAPVAWPTGFSWLAGDPNATSAQPNWTKRYFWQCGDTSKGTHYATPPLCANAASGQGEDALTLIVKFPQCWDGIHFTYPAKKLCPAGTQAFPRLEVHVQYMLASNVELSFATGSIYGAYAGFTNGWDPTLLQSYIDQCVTTGISCHVRSDGTIS